MLNHCWPPLVLPVRRFPPSSQLRRYLQYGSLSSQCFLQPSAYRAREDWTQRSRPCRQSGNRSHREPSHVCWSERLSDTEGAEIYEKFRLRLSWSFCYWSQYQSYDDDCSCFTFCFRLRLLTQDRLHSGNLTAQDAQ